MAARTRHFACATVMLLAAAVAPLPAIDDKSDGFPTERFQRVDDKLFRGAQPTEEGFARLRDLGVKTVINLRIEVDEEGFDERRVVEALGMQYVHLPVKDGNFFTWFRRIPTETVSRFIEIVDKVPGPVFVHCRRGADRTGALVAMYRVARNGWAGDRAADEAGEVGMRGWYFGLRRQIRSFDPTAALAAAAAQ